MKFFSLLFILVSFTISANSQLEKKYWLAGGSGSFYSYKDSYTSTGQSETTRRLTEINLSAGIGYFFIDKLAAGLRPGIISTKSNGTNSSVVWESDTKVYVGPFARYYFLDKDKPFNILIDASYQMGTYRNFGKGASQVTSIKAGPELFFNSSVGIEFLFGYLYQKKSIDDSQGGYVYKQKGFFASVGFQIHLINE